MVGSGDGVGEACDPHVRILEMDIGIRFMKRRSGGRIGGEMWLDIGRRLMLNGNIIYAV